MRDFYFPEWGVWSNQHAKRWEEAFVVGNGNVGAMLFGEPLQQHLILNAPDFFLKGNPMDTVPDLAPYLPEFRKRIQDEGYETAIIYFEEKATELGYPGLTMSDPIHPLLQIDWMYNDTMIKGDSYRRMTDFKKGVVINTFDDEKDQTFLSKTFINNQNELIYILESDDFFSGMLKIINFQQERLKQTLTINKNMWQQVNQYVDHSSYYTNGQIETDGKIEGIENGFAIQQATYIICRVALNEALSPPIDWEEDFRESSQMWQERYEGTSLLLVSEEERLRSIDSIIAEMEASDTIPLVLYEKLYAASRYVLQSCSGTSVPNLQGIWTGTFEPAWSGDYTFDTNVELAIASFSRLGLFQELRAVFDRLKHYFADFQENAQRIYGCRGFFVPSHASTTAKHVQWNQEWPLITWTAGAAWLGHFYAEYADYTGDLNFLREDALPFWKQTILFYEDFLLKQEDALLFRPSYSPENGMGDNATFDVAALKETLTNTIAAHLLLGEPVPGNYREMFEKLPMYAINEEGILKEWIDPKKEEHYNHRHFSQFYPLFESKEIQPDKNPKLWQATEKAFDKKMEAWVTNKDSGNTSSHGRMHAAMCALALGRTSDLQRSLEEFIKNRAFYNSLISAHYNHQNVFNIDANGALPRIYQDAVLYPTEKEKVNLFQAVPDWLETGELRGVYLPGNIKVNTFSWNIKKRTFDLELIASRDTELEITLSPCFYVQKERITLKLKKGKLKRIHFEGGYLNEEVVGKSPT